MGLDMSSSVSPRTWDEGPGEKVLRDLVKG